ncbi:MAG TPA: serine hydrolase domain-containing protein [Bacteroidales bacterium]|nr:serine hydrolase domain-containing protein [Bacteroidales bacterium]HRW94515.1 serine hydrolase domain-containing protein [Bacteroidales bacterium]
MKQPATFSGFSLTVLILIFCFVLATGCRNNPDREKALLLDTLFTTMHARGQFNGNVLIAENGKIIYKNCLGYANREKQIPLNENTLFNTGSVSKIFTAIAIQQLDEKGLLEISDPVEKHLPGFPYPEITIHHLLIHAAGLPEDSHLLQNCGWDRSKIAKNKDLLEALYAQKPTLRFTPGQSSVYNNLGYVVLAHIVEQASGLDFKEYLHQNIFNSAKMERTSIYDMEEIKQADNVAKGYLFYPFTGQYEEAIKIPEFSGGYAVSGFYGDGNVYSTVTDLYRFYRALDAGKLITGESFEKAIQKHILAHNLYGENEYGVSFGYGWSIADAPVTIIQRGGELPGYLSNSIWNLDNDRLIIYLMNDYLAYLSYQSYIYPAYARIMHQNLLEIPKLTASVELTKIAVTGSLEEMKHKIQEIKEQPDLYDKDIHGLQFLVHKLNELDLTEKAALIMDAFQEPVSTSPINQAP